MVLLLRIVTPWPWKLGAVGLNNTACFVPTAKCLQEALQQENQFPSLAATIRTSYSLFGI